MEGDMDDFGDIYADVEGYHNALPGVHMIPSIRQLYLEDQSKAELSPGDEDDDSMDDERLLYDRIYGGSRRSDRSPASAAASHGSDGKTLEGLGEGGSDEVARESSEDSDSDDDLRIVLNEEDCERLAPLHRVGLGNGGLLAGAGAKGDEDDESMNGAGIHHPTKDRKCADPSQLPVDGLEQNGQEIGGYLKGGFVLPYAQFKYVRSQSTGYPSNAKNIGQGFVVPSSSPMDLRSDWDASGSVTAKSGHRGSSTVIPSGFDFHMPRNRTIFDISIESFNCKPWRNRGIDITDFFNFGLNEESWKQYCENMVLFRKQALWMARNTTYGSIRTNQAIDTGFPHGATPVEAALSEVAHCEQGRTAISVVEKPKGKAIQVEGGSGERLPSVDIRRPRYQDSDVVIQIPMEGFDKVATMLPREKLQHVDSFLPCSDNGVYVGHSKANAVHNLSTLHCDGHKDGETANCDIIDQAESDGTVLEVFNEELRSLSDSKGINNVKPRKTGVQVLGTTPASTDDFLHSSSPSSTQSISEASKGDLSVDKQQSPAKKSSFGSVPGSDISDGSSSDTSHSERVKDTANLQNPGLYTEEPRCQPEKKLCAVVVEDDYDSTDLHKKGINKSDSSRSYHGKQGRKCSCNYHSEKHASSLKRTERSKNFERWRCAGKRFSMSSHTEHSCRSAVDSPSSGSCHGMHKCLGRWNSRHDAMKQTEYKIPKRHQDIWGMEFVTDKEKDTGSIPDRVPFCTEKERHASHWLKIVDDGHGHVRPGAVFEDRCMEKYIEGDDSKRFPYFEKNVIPQDELDSDVKYRTHNKSGPQRRGRYHQGLHIEMDHIRGLVEDDDKLWIYSHHKFLDDQTLRGSCSTDGIVWHESSTSRSHKHSSHRSSERYASHCRNSGARDAKFNKQRDWNLPDSCNTDGYSFPYRYHSVFASGCCGIEEWDGQFENKVVSEGRKSGRVSHLRKMTEDHVSLRHQGWGDTHFPEACFSGERSYRDENTCYNDKSLASLKFLHSHFLVNENGIKVPRAVSKAKEQNYMRHREAVNGHVNGYEGKFLGRHGEVAFKKKKIRDDRLDHFDYMVEIHQRKQNLGKRLKMGDNNTQVIRSTVEKVEQCNSENYAKDSNDEPEEPVVMHDQDVSGLEEGQLVEPEDEDAGTVTQKWDIQKTLPISSSEVKHAFDEKKMQVEEISCNKRSAKEYDNSRILETLAKMEKRRQRFKDPIAPKNEQANAVNMLSQVLVVADEVKLERPARKRRWGAV